MKLMIVKRLPDDVLINARRKIFVIKAREEIKHTPSSFLFIQPIRLSCITNYLISRFWSESVIFNAVSIIFRDPSVLNFKSFQTI